MNAQCVVVLGMGGTIAGAARSAVDGVGYHAGQIAVADLLQAVPDLEAVAGGALQAQQVAQLDSKDLCDVHWLDLARACGQALARVEVKAVVVTHGTDTLEETAWWLQSVLPAGKPVVLTCAMRPATAVGADGPVNLRDAVACAVSAGAAARAQAGRGVMVVAGGWVLGAKQVRKTHPYRLQAMDAGDEGPWGWVEEGAVRWAQPCDGVPQRPLAVQMPWQQLPDATQWPWVEVIYSHAGMRTQAVDAWVEAGVQGLVVAGTGNGTVHAALYPALQRAQQAGVLVWRTTRCAQGQVVLGPEATQASERAVMGGAPGLAAGGYVLPAVALSPMKARISLVLALMARSVGARQRIGLVV